MNVNSSVPTAANKNVLRRKKSSLSDIRVTLLGDRDVGKTGESFFLSKTWHSL